MKIIASKQVFNNNIILLLAQVFSVIVCTCHSWIDTCLFTVNFAFKVAQQLTLLFATFWIAHAITMYVAIIILACLCIHCMYAMLIVFSSLLDTKNAAISWQALVHPASRYYAPRLPHKSKQNLLAAASYWIMQGLN